MVDLILNIHAQMDERHIKHAFSGGLALAYYTAHPRATDDIDINVMAGAEDARSILDALPAGVRWNTRQESVLRTLGAVKLRWIKRISVDLFLPVNTHQQGLVDRAQVHQFAGVAIPFVSATDLAVLKAGFSRGADTLGKQRDWADIEAMMLHGALDVTDAMKWIQQIDGPQQAVYGRFVQLVQKVDKRYAQSSRQVDTVDAGTIDPVASPAGSMCGQWMPIARQLCSLPRGHGGKHRHTERKFSS